MPTVDLRFIAPETDPADAYARIGDFARYPDFTDQVVSIEIDDREEDTVVSTWTVKFRRGLLHWVERDTFDRAAGTIEFNQLSGDYAEFRGLWRVTRIPEGTQIDFTAEFDLGMPTLAEILDPVAESALRENITLILEGLLGSLRTVESADRT